MPPRQPDIVLISVPFSDLTATKWRPVIVLSKESLIRADKIYTLSKAIIVKRFGRISERTFQQVMTQLDLLLGR